jgi:hypothetical protein
MPTGKLLSHYLTPATAADNRTSFFCCCLAVDSTSVVQCSAIPAAVAAACRLLRTFDAICTDVLNQYIKVMTGHAGID